MKVIGRRFLFVLAAGLWAALASSQMVQAATVVTQNFDTPDVNVPLGASPFTATLVGGTQGEVVGIGNLYDTGIRAWMFRTGESGAIQLESAITRLDVFFAHVAGLSGTMQFFDSGNSLVGSINSLEADTAMPPIQELTFATPVTDVQISIAGDSGFVAIDSLSIEFAEVTEPTVVPIPAALPLFVSALAGLSLAARRKRQPV